jgi:hypothetical protein
MKKLLSGSVIAIVLVSTFIFSACKRYLTSPPVGTLSSSVLANKVGVDGLLIGAYSLLDGYYSGVSLVFASPVSNWTFGGISSDDAIKGSSSNDQFDATTISNHSVDPTNGYLPGKWDVQLYGIQRANDVLRELPLVKDGSVSPAYAAQVAGEARFLRGFYELEMAKCWGPYAIYVSDSISYANNNINVPNGVSILPKIEEDFKAAMNALPATQQQIGRANKYAAEAFLAKTYMFDHNYAAAKPLLEDLIANGVTSSGAKYALNKHFADNFNPSLKNSPEGVFEVQMSVKDGSSGANGNVEDILNFPLGGPSGCCGFYQPSFSLVNSYKVDADGLPLLDTWNDYDLKSDQGIAADKPFTPTTDAVDPRLDWTVGRRGIPYLDWGIMPGDSWIREQSTAGPYSGMKSVYYQAAAATTSDNFGGWGGGGQGQITANNYKAIRFADVILWAAECEVEVGSLAQAEKYVNMIRARAADPTGFVHTYIDPAKPMAGYTNTPAANYMIGLYTGQIATGTKDFARKAVWFERKLELAMEGHRFFDLQRYDSGPAGGGYMAAVMKAYIAHETNIPGFTNPVQKGATFTAGKNEIFPVPINEIDKSGGILKQAHGY